jgi:hypothetical protein
MTMTVRNVVKSIQDIMRQDSGADGDAQRISVNRRPILTHHRRPILTHVNPDGR